MFCSLIHETICNDDLLTELLLLLSVLSGNNDTAHTSSYKILQFCESHISSYSRLLIQPSPKDSKNNTK